MKDKKLFSETSILACYYKDKYFKHRVKDILNDFNWKATSYYCLLEFGNVVLSPACYLLGLFNKGKLWGEVISHVNNCLLPAHKSKKIWTLNLIAHLKGNEKEQTERAILYLKLLLRTSITNFIKLFDDVTDEVSCYWIKENIKTLKPGKATWQSPKCTKDNPRCNIADFFTENKDHFISIKDDIDKLASKNITEQLKSFSELIELACAEPEILLDYKKGCRKFADALIAIESFTKGYSSFFTQNIYESKVLCKTLEQDLIYLPNNLNKDVEYY